MRRFAIALACVLMTAAVSADQIRLRFVFPSSPGDPVTVTITDPTSSATYNNGEALTIDLGGTATGSPSSCTGAADTTGSFAVSGTTTWTADDIDLLVGDNVLTVTCDGEDDTLTVTVEDEGEGPPLDNSDDNAYFDELCALEWATACYSLRSDAEINMYDEGSGDLPNQADVAYDASMDAARWDWVNGDVNGEELHFPLDEMAGTGFAHPMSGTQKFLVIYDMKWDDRWDTNCDQGGPACGWKLNQITEENEDIWWEGQNYVGQGFPVETFGQWHFMYWREYNTPVPPSDMAMGGQPCAPTSGFNLDPDIHPSLDGCFVSNANEWIRIATEVIHNAGDTYMGSPYAIINTWAMDEDTGVTQLISSFRQLCEQTTHDQFFWELNTSASTLATGGLSLWSRNIVVLKDYDGDATDYLRAPFKSDWTFEEDFESYSNAVLHNQGDWVGFNSSGETNYTVQATVASSGSKAVAVTPLSTHSEIINTLGTTVRKGNVFVSMRKTHTTTSSIYFTLRDTVPATRMYVRMGPEGNFGVYNGDTSMYETLGAYSANTWYRVQVQFNDYHHDNQYRARFRPLDDPDGWSAWSDWVTVNGGSYTNIEAVYLDTDGDVTSGAHVGYFDDISATD